MNTIFAVFLLMPMTTGFKSCACKWRRNVKCTQHNMSCEDREQIRIISGYYGFTYFCCLKDDYDPDDCFLRFNDTVESNLVDSCNGKKTCNFETPNPDYKSCYYIENYNGRKRYVGYNAKYYDTYNYYKYSCIQYECSTVTTTLPTTSEQITRQIYTTIQSTEKHNSKPENPTESYTSEVTTTLPTTREQITRQIYTTTQSTEKHNSKPENPTESYTSEDDTTVIAGSVLGCILLVMLVIIAIVVILKRKTMWIFIGRHFKGSPRVCNPVYEAPSDGYNNVIFKNDNSPSGNVVISDDYSHLHDIKNDNSMTTGNTYNHLGQTMGDYNHLHANNNRPRVVEHSDGAYNHLSMANNETRSLEERHNANYNHIGDSEVDKSDADYNNLHRGKNEITKAVCNHLGEIKKTEIQNDYNHIRDVTNEKIGGNYHHLGNVNEHVVDGDDYNHIGDTKHGTIVEYELAHNGNLYVHEEQTRENDQDEQPPEDVQYEITDEEKGDYSNIPQRKCDYENFPISDHKSR